MTDTFTEEQIREALLGQARANNDYVVTYTEQVIAALKKPKFAEGEVLVHKGRDGDLTFVQWGDTSWSPAGLQKLNLTEHGPEVKALRDFVYSLSSLNAMEAAKAFDEVIHD